MGFDFVQSAGLVAGRGGQTIAFDRDTSAWYFNAAGTLTSAGNDVARFDYNPSTLAALGLLEEQASTNSVRNAVMTGATAGVVGAGGAEPTGWPGSSLDGTTETIVGTGTEDGINYIEIRYNKAGSANFSTLFESTTQIVAADAQTWTSTMFVRLVGGSLTNVASFPNRLVFRTVLGALVTAQNVELTPTSAALRTQRSTNTFLAADATIERVTNQISWTATGAFDFTVRIGVPQLEQKAIATSPILSAGSATTRNLDRLTIGTLTPWFNAAGGTIVARVAMGLPVSGSNHSILRFSDNSYDNSIRLAVSSTGYPQIGVFSGGIDTGVATDTTVMVADTFTTIAVSYQSGRLEISQNGGAVTADTSFTFPSGMTRLDLLGDHAGGNAPTRAWLKWLRYYPRAYIGSSLQQLSSLT